MALMSVYPETHYGAFAAEPGWQEMLPSGIYGEHPAWHAPADALKENGRKTALIPWLLFNRHLWEEKAESLPGGSESLNLIVPHAAHAGDYSKGWYVRLIFSEELELTGVEIVSMDDESAPASEGFDTLPKGALPPAVRGPRRRLMRLIASLLLLFLSAAAVGATVLLLRPDAEEAASHKILVADLRALREQEAILRADWNEKQSLGLAVHRVERLLMDAIWFDSQVELQGRDVGWRGGNGQPFGLRCDEVRMQGGRQGWRSCWWEEP